MADAIESYLANPELRREHGSRGRRRAETEFILEGMVQHYLAVYDSVLGRS